MPPLQSKPDKIKIIYAYAAFYRGAGGEMHPKFLAKHLNRNMFDFSVCVIENSRSSIRLEIEASGTTIHDLNLSRRFYNVFNVVRIVRGFYRIFKTERPQIVQTQALHANLLARMAAMIARVPNIISTENSLPDIETSKIKRILNLPLHLLNRLLDRSTDRIVVVSEQLKSLKSSKNARRKIEVIPPPFNIEAFDAARSSLGEVRPFANPEKITIGIVGRLSPEKGHRYLIAAMPEILSHAPGTRLKILGLGPLADELKNLAAALHVSESTIFEGYKSDIFSELARIDILFVPSLSDAFPIVIMEGMAMGIPVVGTRVGGIPEMIQHRVTGLLVQPRDSVALAEAFETLCLSPDTGIRMGRRGRERVLSNYHPSQFISRHENLYRQLVTGGN
jgi:glycosyltransferase involved in cell wall biosynthesis